MRTLKSDLESMAQSGGVGAQFQNVKAPGLSRPDDGQVPGEKESSEVSTGEKKPISTSTILVIVIAIGLVAAIGYLVYALFLGPKPEAPATQQSLLPPATLTPPPAPPSRPSASASFVHASFFKKPADQLLTLTVNSSATTATDLSTITQRISALVLSANSSSAFSEIDFKDGNGNDLTAPQMFDALNFSVIDPQFYAAHFSSDATFFVHKDATGSWPGLVLSLKSGENWLFVKSDVAKLEQSPAIGNLFLSLVGNPSASGFKDKIEAGQPARILTFAVSSSSAASASFVYGWFHNVLVLSTSEAGLIEAISRL